MITTQMIKLGRDDRHILRHIEHAANLAGVAEFDTNEMRKLRETDLPGRPEEERIMFHELKSLRRLSSDMFEWSDVERADRLIRRLAAAKTARANAGAVFADEAIQKVFSDGVRASAEQAIYELDTFRGELAELTRGS